MPSNLNFKKSTLNLSVRSFIQWNDPGKQCCLTLFLMLSAQHGFAQTPASNTLVNEAEFQQQLKSEAVKQGRGSDENLAKIENFQEENTQPLDSLQMLQQQEQAIQPLAEFIPIEFEDLEQLPVAPVSQSMADEIFRVAEDAKSQAQQYRAGQVTEMVMPEVTQQELAEINQAPVNVDQLISSIQADSQIVVEANESGKTLAEVDVIDELQEPSFFKRWLYKIRPSRQLNTAKVPRIRADVDISTVNSTQVADKDYTEALENLKTNIKGKLSTFTQESFSDFPSALPQLRTMSNQAAQAVGFYNAKFKFEKVSDARVRVSVTPNAAVRIEQQNIEFSGAGENQPQFQVIRILPDQDVDDIFNHGLYEKTKTRIRDAASNNGFFDGYWRLHDVKVAQPQDTADINLRYETGERYKLGAVEFRMSDPAKPFPLDLDVLQSMVSWQDGADYTFWRVNGLANNLTNSRYFNYTLVDAVRPDPIELPLELPPDIQALVDQQKLSERDATTQGKKTEPSSKEVTQSVVDETQFAGKADSENNPNLRQLRMQQEDKQTEDERLKLQAREEKKIPVIVTLNADQLNSAEVGAGYGTDTGVRVRGQYRRAIVNRRGHSFDANLEVSKIRQSVDGRYNIPYKHPLNDYISLVAGYEREERNNVAQGNGLMIESAVGGADRIIKKPLGRWQHTFGVRYRLDRITQDGIVDFDQIPDAFLANANEQQQSLLAGYEASLTSTDKRLNPSKGFKQTYKVELGSETLLSDADMAILNASWRFIYSLGENDNHQFVGRGDLGYIVTNDFTKVPYNLRYFTGGDQTIRGFDYKSLSPQLDGFKIGGQALAVGSLEYNYQFKEGWRAAVFTDVGNAYDQDFKTPTAYGVGLGVRWASPIGPIRIDVASGISDDDHPIRIHFFIGSPL